jgi:predicted dehydrogenase
MKKISGPIRWGIVATGGIAAKFAEACKFEEKRSGLSTLAAVASRDAAKASEFAKKWGIPVSYGSYEALFADPSIDAVYIATPHSSHAELSISALKAGKHVLCEKSVALTGSEFAPVIETARKTGLFFMEAMWMKFNPSFRKALSWLESGRIGTPKFIRADFFLNAPYDPQSRLYDPALGGGALLDVGIYPVTFAVVMAGKTRPDHLSSIINPGPAGIDLYNKQRFTWKSGLAADLSSAINLQGIKETRSAVVLGDKGSITLPFFWMAQETTLLDAEGTELERYDAPFDCNGYEYEIREVERCLNLSQTESSVQTWADSIMVMDILDEIRMVATNE